MRNGLNQCHLQNNIFKVFEDTCTWVQYLQNVCCANKVCPCFLILLLQLLTTAAQQESSLPRQCPVLSCLPHKLQTSRICVGVLTSCFSSWSLFPLSLCCLSLICASLLPCASSISRCGTFSQFPALEGFLSSASYSLMQYNWASSSNPLPYRIFPNLLIRMPQCWPGWSSETAVHFCCWRILTLETSKASGFCINSKFCFLCGWWKTDQEIKILLKRTWCNFPFLHVLLEESVSSESGGSGQVVIQHCE